jgi:hypothetical protein
MVKPLLLTSDQETAIDRAASALHPSDQPAFYARVHEQLEGAPEIGDGVVYRACAAVQRSLFKPPRAEEFIIPKHSH